MATTTRSRKTPKSKPMTTELFVEQFDAIVDNISTVIKGKSDQIRIAMTGFLAGGNVLFEDMPGTGKTMLARAFATTINADASRVQCTPDLLPGDITGSPVLDRKTGDFVFRPGPVFANVFLADEINRATPKTQSALLEAMSESQVTVDGFTYELPKPFFVIATQNPVEQAGTFPLPEAQLDRFLFKLTLGYADRAAELELLTANERHQAIDDIKPVTDPASVVEMMEFTREVNVSSAVALYIVDICQATRNDPSLQVGGSSRASQALRNAARVMAASQGRDDVLPDDVKKLVGPVLNHRLLLTPDAMLRDETVEGVLERILNRVKLPMGIGGDRSLVTKAKAEGSPSFCFRLRFCGWLTEMADKKARNPRVAQSLAAGSGVVGWIELHLGITSSGLLLLGFTAMAFLIGNIVGSVALYMLGYGVLLVMGVSWMMGRRKLAVTAGRTDLPRRVREGQRVAVELSLQAQRRISTIVLEEELLDPLGVPVRVPVPILPAGEDVLHPYTFTPKRRGVYSVGPLVAEWSDPFGLTKRREVLAEAQEIMVHPSTEPVTDMVTQREWEDPPIRPPLSKPWPTGFEFYGMRDYVPGDDPRRIVWRKTAQMLDENGQGRYLVKESEQGITDRVNILLDTDRATHTPGVPSATFELAIRTAASLGASHIHNGFSLTIDVNESRLVKRLRGRGNRITMLDALARLELESDSFSKAIERLLIDPGRQAHNIVITPHLDQATAARLGLLVDRGVSMLLVHIMHEDTDPISMHRAAGIGAKVVEVSAGKPMERVFRKVSGAFRS